MTQDKDVVTQAFCNNNFTTCDDTGFYMPGSQTLKSLPETIWYRAMHAVAGKATAHDAGVKSARNYVKSGHAVGGKA
jgi:hypothetical protein